MSRAILGAIAVTCVALACALAGCGDKTKKPGSCKSDKDCKAPQVCDANKCVECKTDANCPKGKRCSAGACIAAPECTKDDQCALGQVCQAGKCKPCATSSRE